MSLPALLLVDDSEAVLAFGRAALSGHYQIHTAQSGVEALAKLGRLRPAAVLLDLSMPQMDGDEVLIRMKRDPLLARVPVVILSSEKGRAAACLAAGAASFIAKPARAAELLAGVNRAVEEAELAARAGARSVLLIEAGSRTLALALESIVAVVEQPAVEALDHGPDYLRERLVLWGEPLPVLDLPRRLGVEHSRRLEERQLVVVRDAAVRLALCVDRVHDPEELPASALQAAPSAAAATAGLFPDGLTGLARSSLGEVALIGLAALLSPAQLAEMAGAAR